MGKFKDASTGDTRTQQEATVDTADTAPAQAVRPTDPSAAQQAGAQPSPNTPTQLAPQGAPQGAPQVAPQTKRRLGWGQQPATAQPAAARLLQDYSLREFAEALGSSAPTPGGGGASALTGVLAVALAEMVAQLTVGRAKFQAAEAAAKQVLTRAQEIRAELLRLVDADAQAYATVSAAYALPKKTPEERAARDAALQRALIRAMQPPLEMMGLAVETVVLAGQIATVGNPQVASDAGCAAVLADAAARAAALNVMANLASMKDCPEKAEASERIRRMRGRITALRLRALTRVFERMGLRPEPPLRDEAEDVL